jgi:hypothetical protein
MGLGAKLPNVQEVLNSQDVWSMYSAAGNFIRRPYRPEGTRENGQFGWGTLTHSNLGKPEKAAASTTQ